MELNSDDTPPSLDLKERNYPKEDNEIDSPKVCPQPKMQNTSVAEKDQDVNYIVLSDPGLLICPVGELMDSASALSPPLPPKCYKTSPAFEKTLSQSPQLKVFNKENKPSNSLACWTSPALGGVKINNQCLDLIQGEALDMPLPPLRPFTKSPIQTPEPNKLQRAERNRPEHDITERNEKTKENKETSERHLDVGKPPRQILVIFTDKFGEDKGKEEDDHGNIGSTFPTMTENVSPLGKECSDLIPDEETNMGATNRDCTSTVSAKPEPTIPVQPPPKPPRNRPPKPPVKPPQLYSTLRAGIEAEKERRQLENEHWTDFVDKERDEYEEERMDSSKLNRDPKDTEFTTSAMTEMPSHLGQTPMESILKLCLQLPCLDRPTSIIAAKNQTPDCQSQHPRKQYQNKANGQVRPGLQRVAPAWVNPIGTDSTTERLNWTEISKEIQISDQVISKLPSGCKEAVVLGTKLDPGQRGLQRSEDTQVIAGTLPDGELKQRTNTKGKVKKLAKKMIDRLKDGREERRRLKIEEMEINRVREDERSYGEEGEIKDDDDGEGEDADQPALTETHAELMERKTERRNATSDSPFSSFKVCSPVKLVEEVLSGDDWFQFLNRDQSATPDPPDSPETAEPCGDFLFTPEVCDENPAVPEEEPVYEDMHRSNIEEQQEMNRTPSAAVPTTPMSPRTKGIYDTVMFIPPVQPKVTHIHFSDIKSQVLLDSSVQKYLIKLSKKRRRRAARARRGDKNHANIIRLSLSSTSPQQVFPASVFYCVPASGREAEQQPPTVKSGGSSPRSLAKIKSALKDKTILRAAQPKEDQGT
ncbi:uncharacterized protein si:dkey-9i23.6 [Plectropomus leopardus]|uniref:uncharacterized protein si:dkey-9i23.6 n=1 Tax=Plectropomus leopardus TaxID=160734 RepID=UPI001C4C441E|nr:uncharacterized protein si:dkey-9i23.6 [Plectropomus leopardus]